MPRIFKGTETLLKLFVPRVDEGNLETLKIGLFTDDTNNAAEFYGDNMSIDGDTVYLKVNAWSFDMMNDGVLNYIAEIEIGEETIITERQSNYYLKTPNQYVPVGPDLSDYYTKPEIDEMLEDIEVDVDLTGYATEQWVEDKTYATEQYVNDAIANIDIPEGGGSDTDYKFYSIVDRRMTDDEWYEIYNNNQEGIASYISYKLYDTTAQGFATFGFYEGYISIVITTAQEQVIWRQGDVSGTEAWHKVVSLNSGSDDVDLSNYYTKTEIDGMIGDINNILETI